MSLICKMFGHFPSDHGRIHPFAVVDARSHKSFVIWFDCARCGESNALIRRTAINDTTNVIDRDGKPS